MASNTYHTILIQAAPEGALRKEALAGEANIKPGHLLKLNSSGALIRHDAAAGVLTGKLIALETLTPDDEANASIDVAYDNGDRVYYAIGRPGERYLMFLKAGQNAALGAQLVSGANGELQVATPDATTVTNTIVGFAAEAKDNSGGGSAVRVIVEII